MTTEYQTQVCIKCDEELPLELFGRGSRSNGKDGRCKSCRKLFYKENKKSILKTKKELWESGGREKYYKSKSTVESFLKRLLSARKDNKRDCLSFEDLYTIWHNQKGLCALTGKPMTHVAGKGRLFDNVSIDRIDSTKGYEKENIQLVRCGLNYMKHTCSLDKFLDICKEVIEYHGK